MKDHTVSVVIPTYRAAATIGRALESLFAQTRRPEQIIVVDDGSPDDLTAALARYANRITVIRQENAGASAARNRGIEAATGSLIAFLDADDYWEPEKLQRQIDVFNEHPQVGLVAGEYFHQPPGGRKTPQQNFEAEWVDRVVRAQGVQVIELGSLIWTCTVLVRKNALGTNRFVSGLEPAEDRDLWIRILRDQPVFILSRPMATAVLEPDSLSRGDADFGYGPMIRVLRRHTDLLQPAELRRLEARVYRGWAGAHLANRFGRSAFKPATKRLVREPFSAEAWWVVGKSMVLSVMNPKAASVSRIVSPDGRGEASLRRHYQIERELANRLRAATPQQRQQLYGEVYNELFKQVADHPANTRKADPAQRAAMALWQWRLLSHFVTPESVYLEVGAGDCALAMSVAGKAKQSIAVDVSDVIAASEAKPTNFTLLITDGVRMPVPPASVNVAYSNQLMEHLHPDDAAAQLAEIRRSLLPGGVYVCVTPHHHSGPWDISKFFATEPYGFHLKEYTYRELHDLMLRAGFVSTSVWAGLKGKFFRIPQFIVLGIESLIGRLPRGTQKSITRNVLMRPVFTNVMIVGHVECAPAKSAGATATRTLEVAR